MSETQAPALTPSQEQAIGIFMGSAWDLSPTFTHLRENDPVLLLPGLDVWMVSRYDDVVTVIRDVERFGNWPSDIMNQVPEEVAEDLPEGYSTFRPALVNSTPEQHRRIRKLTNRPLTRPAVAKQEGLMRETADALIDSFVEDGRADLVSRFAAPFPLAIFSAMLGVPDEDRELFQKWAWGTTELFLPTLTPERRIELAREQVDYNRYITEAIAARRKSPGEDLISQLVLAQEGHEERLSDAEIEAVVAQLITAGTETTQAAIMLCLERLVAHPDVLDRVRADLSLVPAVVEEALRWMPTARGFFRETTADVELGGQSIPKGAKVFVLIGAANQDPDHFSCPGHFDIEREPSEMRKHVGFGQGVHKCIGAELARLELRVAVEHLIVRLANIRMVADQDVVMAPGFIFHGPQRVDFEWDA